MKKLVLILTFVIGLLPHITHKSISISLTNIVVAQSYGDEVGSGSNENTNTKKQQCNDDFFTTSMNIGDQHDIDLSKCRSDALHDCRNWTGVGIIFVLAELNECFKRADKTAKIAHRSASNAKKSCLANADK